MAVKIFLMAYKCICPRAFCYFNDLICYHPAYWLPPGPQHITSCMFLEKTAYQGMVAHVLLVLGRLRQENYLEFKTNLGYIVRARQD